MDDLMNGFQAITRKARVELLEFGCEIAENVVDWLFESQQIGHGWNE